MKDLHYVMASCTTNVCLKAVCVAKIVISPEVKYRKRRGDQGQPVPGGSSLVSIAR